MEVNQSEVLDQEVCKLSHHTIQSVQPTETIKIAARRKIDYRVISEEKC